MVASGGGGEEAAAATKSSEHRVAITESMNNVVTSIFQNTSHSFFRDRLDLSSINYKDNVGRVLEALLNAIGLKWNTSGKCMWWAAEPGGEKLSWRAPAKSGTRKPAELRATAMDGVDAMSSGWRGAHDSIGLAEFGRCVYCDVCDLNMSNGACMAGYVLQERRVASVVTKHTKMHARKPWGDLDRREARHALYKAVIYWQFCSDLGAGNRVRLPKCVVLAIRRLFPNPLRGCACDLWHGAARARARPGLAPARG